MVIKTFAETPGPCILSTGQAGFIIKSEGGETLAIDLYLSDSVEVMEEDMGVKRLLPKLFDPETLHPNIVIATHFHADHYDRDAIPGLMKHPDTRLYASNCCRELVEEQRLDKTRVRYIQHGDVIEQGDFRITFVPCDHGEAAPHAVGVVVETSGKCIYEVGDSCLRPDIAEEVRRRFGAIDVLIGPINGAYGNMNEEEFAGFTHVIGPGLCIPCHYGMFAAHGGNPGKFYDIMKTRYPEQGVLLMAQGEVVKL